jgi:hypothetical protein
MSYAFVVYMSFKSECESSFPDRKERGNHMKENFMMFIFIILLNNSLLGYVNLLHVMSNK